MALILGVYALRSYLKLICEYELHSLPNKKVSGAMDHGIKTTSKSDRPWSAIFCLIVYGKSATTLFTDKLECRMSCSIRLVMRHSENRICSLIQAAVPLIVFGTAALTSLSHDQTLGFH